MLTYELSCCVYPHKFPLAKIPAISRRCKIKKPEKWPGKKFRFYVNIQIIMVCISTQGFIREQPCNISGLYLNVRQQEYNRCRLQFRCDVYGWGRQGRQRSLQVLPSFLAPVSPPPFILSPHAFNFFYFSVPLSEIW